MNIIQMLLGLLNNPQILGSLSGLVGESSATTQKGIAAAIPAILGSLISKGSTESGAGSLIDMMKEHKIDGSMLDQLGGVFGGGATQAHASAGNSILRGILGDKLGSVVDLVSSVSGMSSGNASNLMALAAPAVMGGVAKAAPAGGLSAPSLMGLLSSQKEHLAAFAPPGLGNLLGIGGLGAAASSMAGAASAAMGSTASAASSAMQGAGAGASAMASSATGGAMWPWLVVAGLVGLAALLGLRTCSTRPEATVAEAPAPATTEPVAPTAPAEPAAPATTKITLPSGVAVEVPAGSVGDNLFKFVTGSDTGSKTFLFDGLTFDTGKATLDASSRATINTIAGIMNEFKTVTASVDGYTDNSGDKAANLALSKARAEAVMQMLVAGGIDASRITAVGHGDDKPVADNGTEEGRAQNRRTELTATKH